MMRAGHKARDVVDRQIGTGGSRKVDIGIKCTLMNGLHPNHFDHQSFVADEAKLAAVPCLKSRLHRGHITKSYLDTAIGPHIADVHSRFAADVAVDALSAQFCFRFGRQALHNRPKRCLFQRAAKCALAYRPPIRETHAISRQYPRQRMNHHTVHAKRIRHQTGMLPACAAKAGQGITRDIMPALNGDFLDRIGHVGNRNCNETFGNFFRAHLLSGRGCNVHDKRFKFIAYDVGVERLVAVGSKYVREMRRNNLAQHDVAIRHRQRPTTPVTGRSGYSACRMGSNLETRTVKRTD